MNIFFTETTEKWGVFEISTDGPQEGNPFTEHSVKAVFTGKSEEVTVYGFYDGNGIYKVRFMPSFEGLYSFILTADFLTEELSGSFLVTAAQGNNHGPVRVANTFHFAYEDGTPYYSIGTTCYVWELQSEKQKEETLANLVKYGFNKIRFCIFPKHYAYNLKEPPVYPYSGTPADFGSITADNFYCYGPHSEGNSWDFTRFNPAYFQMLEESILKLMENGIEADLILMHPYDRWGFSCMEHEADLLYLRYVTARFAAFRNVWWSLANEYDLLKEKSIKDWESFASVIIDNDPYRHLRSIHNCGSFYDYNRPWITHCSIQRQDLYKTAELVNECRSRYKKPVVLDEIAYEGNIQYGWGNITGEELLRRFWEAACRGGYAGHGETYLNPDDILWWSHGGALHGESHKRFRFLYDILLETPGIGLKPYDRCDFDEVCGVPENWALRGTYYLFYYSFMRPSFRDYRLDGASAYDVYVIDTWNMTKEYAGQFCGHFRIELPGRQFIAVQIKRVTQNV